MKLECNRNALSAAFGAVGAVIPSKTPKPILLSAKLKVTGTTTTVIGTDSEISIRYEVPQVKCTGNGEVLVPVKRINDILRELRDETVTLQVKEKLLLLTGGRSEFKLPTSDASEYPEVEEFFSGDYLTVQSRVLQTMIRRTLFATDTDSARYALSGILFDVKGKRLNLVSTDSRRLAMMGCDCEMVGNFEMNVPSPVIPEKAVSILEKTLADNPDFVSFTIDPKGAMFKSQNVTLSTRLVEGRFPEYTKVIPKSHNMSISLIAGMFHSAVKQALIVTNEESRGVDFTFEKGNLVMCSQAADVGESRVELPIGYDGEDLTIRLDPRFVSDFLRVLSSELTVDLKLMDGDSPGLFTTEDGYNYVVMPLIRES